MLHLYQEHNNEKVSYFNFNSGVTYIIYTDEDLVLMDEIWSEMKNLLEVPQVAEELEFALIDEIDGLS